MVKSITYFYVIIIISVVIIINTTTIINNKDCQAIRLRISIRKIFPSKGKCLYKHVGKHSFEKYATVRFRNLKFGFQLTPGCSRCLLYNFNLAAM